MYVQIMQNEYEEIQISHAKKELTTVIFINTYKILMKIEGIARYSKTLSKVIQGTKYTPL